MTNSLPYSFVPGTKARAQEVNANFLAVMETMNSMADINLSNITKIGIDKIKNNCSIRNIGELVYSTIPINDAALHLLDGSLISGSGSYGDFVNYIDSLFTEENNTANYFCTETEWQEAVEKFGVCGKFVYDSSANTVRLPKITGIVEGTTDINSLGDLVKAGLPVHTHTKGTMNITGNFTVNGNWSHYGEANGAFTKGSSNMGSNQGGASDGGWCSFNAANTWNGNTSEPVYNDSDIQNSNTVQPQTVKVFCYIVIATSTKTDVQVNIDNIATDLNSKANIADVVDRDASNFTTQGTTYLSGLGMPSNRYIDLTIGANGTEYTAPANGWVNINCQLTANQAWQAWIKLTTSKGLKDSEVFYFNTASTQGLEANLILPVLKGDKFSLTWDKNVSTVFVTTWETGFRFYYTEGTPSE